MSRPTVPVRPATNPRAIAFGVKDSSSAARSTRRRVASATSSRPLSALDAVAIETWARLATSPSVTARFAPLPFTLAPSENLIEMC